MESDDLSQFKVKVALVSCQLDTDRSSVRRGSRVLALCQLRRFIFPYVTFINFALVYSYPHFPRPCL